jgi:PAS domain-containing protein
VIHPDDLPVVGAAWQRALAEGDQFRCDCRLRRHDGEWRIFDNHALPQKDGNGVILSWVGSSTDAPRRARRTLRCCRPRRRPTRPAAPSRTLSPI